MSSNMRSIQSTPELVAQGKALYNACGACHGPEGGGRVGIGPRLNSESFLAAASDEMLVRTIGQGRPGTTMIPWGTSYKPEQIQALVAFIRSWGAVAPADLNEAPLTGNAEAGKKVFGAICSACHGRTGAGYQETANGTGIGRRAFLTQVSDGYLRHIIKHGKSETKMGAFAEDNKVAVANLTDQQVEDVISYLRGYAW